MASLKINCTKSKQVACTKPVTLRHGVQRVDVYASHNTDSRVSSDVLKGHAAGYEFITGKAFYEREQTNFLPLRWQDGERQTGYCRNTLRPDGGRCFSISINVLTLLSPGHLSSLFATATTTLYSLLKNCTTLI